MTNLRNNLINLFRFAFSTAATRSAAGGSCSRTFPNGEVVRHLEYEYELFGSVELSKPFGKRGVVNAYLSGRIFIDSGNRLSVTSAMR